MGPKGLMHECEDCQYNWSSQHTVHPNRCTVSLWGGVTNLWEYRDNKCHCPNLLQCIYRDLKRTVSQSISQVTLWLLAVFTIRLCCVTQKHRRCKVQSSALDSNSTGSALHCTGHFFWWDVVAIGVFHSIFLSWFFGWSIRLWIFRCLWFFRLPLEIKQSNISQQQQ